MDTAPTDLVAFEHGVRVEFPQLDKVLEELCIHIENVTSSLYDQQKAAVALRLAFDSSKGKQFRQDLNQEWEKIIELLGQFRLFEQDVQLFQKNLVKISREDGLELLRDLHDIGSSISNELRKLLEDPIQLDSPYNPRGGNHLNEFGVLPVYSQTSFYGTIARPGLISGEEFRAATQGVKNAMEKLLLFWQGQIVFIQQQKAALETAKVTLAFSEAQRYAEIWRKYDATTRDSIVRITKACDAIVIEPLPLYRPMHPPAGPDLVQRWVLTMQLYWRRPQAKKGVPQATAERAVQTSGSDV
ncbi:hypothetical protein FRC17_004359 [Serendipita sp. 399]|nr:hypothetical protein FRC17_004359 [Serendipita sp. 399]